MTKIVVIRIRGQVNTPKEIEDTFYLLRLRRKFSCVVIDKTDKTMGMVKKIKDYIAFGEINQETLKQLLLKRALKKGNKSLEIGGKAIDEFIIKFLDNKAKLSDLKIKPFFRLHPPRGGFKKSIKKQYPLGILGDHGIKINDLIKKML